jgi:viroplasmin and RNaseH domain-containing protein
VQQPREGRERTRAAVGGKSRSSSRKDFYAVARGRAIGIYRTWAEAQAQTRGYSDARHQGFTAMEDAVTYMREEDCRLCEDGTWVEGYSAAQ